MRDLQRKVADDDERKNAIEFLDRATEVISEKARQQAINNILSDRHLRIPRENLEQVDE
jgi:hypothetical protein